MSKKRVYQCGKRQIEIKGVPDTAIHFYLIREVERQSTRKASYVLEDYNPDLSYFLLVDKADPNKKLTFRLVE